MRDLKDSKLIHFKGWAFLFILVGASSLLLLRSAEWRDVLLLALVIWSAARFYYYLFYVIENYVDADYRFSGVASALRYLFHRQPRADSETVETGHRDC